MLYEVITDALVGGDTPSVIKHGQPQLRFQNGGGFLFDIDGKNDRRVALGIEVKVAFEVKIVADVFALKQP